MKRTVEFRPEWTWPIGIVIVLILVMAVNAAFIYVAISGADPVVESYESEPR